MDFTCQLNETTLQRGTNRLVWCLTKKDLQQQDVQHIYVHIYLPTTNTKKGKRKNRWQVSKKLWEKKYTHFTVIATLVVVLYTKKPKNINGADNRNMRVECGSVSQLTINSTRNTIQSLQSNRMSKKLHPQARCTKTAPVTITCTTRGTK